MTGRSAAHARRHHVVERLRDLLLEDVDREFHEHGAGAPVLDLGESAAHGVGHGVGHDHLLDPLGHVPVVE
jgi:hypothetical protein